MTQSYQDHVAQTETALSTQNPTDDHTDVARVQYTSVDHFSHVTGIAVSVFYIVAALATLYEVFSRYVMNAPTYWAFETVMMICAAAWMLSAGYITLKQRHIAITVIHSLTTPRQQWMLDAFAMIVGIFALYMLLSDATIRSYDSIIRVEKSGSAFNSPMPMMMKALMVVGAFMYLAQLVVNLHRHVTSAWAKTAIKIIAAYFVLYFTAGFLGHFFDIGIAETFSNAMSDVGKSLDPSKALQMRKMDLGTVSVIMVLLLIALMMTGMPLGIVGRF